MRQELDLQPQYSGLMQQYQNQARHQAGARRSVMHFDKNGSDILLYCIKSRAAVSSTISESCEAGAATDSFAIIYFFLFICPLFDSLLYRLMTNLEGRAMCFRILDDWGTDVKYEKWVLTPGDVFYLPPRMGDLM